jgi:uncharacterized protein YjiS (DUF1127 family)
MTFSLSTVRATRRSRAKPTLGTCFAVWAERRSLGQMDVHRLKDMGISPVDAAAEVARPF